LLKISECPAPKSSPIFMKFSPTTSTCLNNEKMLAGKFFKMNYLRDTVVVFSATWALGATFDQKYNYI
jgi:hypothetical protein